jgi:hypothetical protein
VNQIKIKLIAVAKDEAAYLPSWIFHHLYVGFDALDIYVNNTSDNTWQYAEHLKTESRVTFLDGDDLFEKNPHRPQEAIYKHAVKSLKGTDFTHAMFLDIDEYWLNKDTSKGIKDVIASFPLNSVIGFAWLNRVNEKPFDNVICSTLAGYNGAWVKSCFPLRYEIERVDVHSVKIPECDYFFSNGFKRSNKYAARERDSQEGAARFTAPFLNEAPLESFICHRMYRSEKEYVSLLGRGRPNSSREAKFTFKDNRNGYVKESDKHHTVEFGQVYASEYAFAYQEFLATYSLIDTLDAAKSFISLRYEEVVKQIYKASAENYFTFERIFLNVHLPDVAKAKEHFSKRTKSKAYKLKSKQEKLTSINLLKEL